MSAHNPLSLPRPPQYLSYGFAIIVSSIWLVLWAKLRYKSPSEAQTLWRAFVWYMALVFLCSILGMSGASFFFHSKLTLFDVQAQKAMGILSARQLYMTQAHNNVLFGYYLSLRLRNIFGRIRADYDSAPFNRPSQNFMSKKAWCFSETGRWG